MRKWQLGTKLFTGSVLSLLLAVGLCGAGFTLEGSGGAVKDFEFKAGLLFLAGAVLLLVAAIIAWIVAPPKDGR